MSSRIDNKSEKIQVKQYIGTTTTGPSGVISKRIFANESYPGGSTQFTTSQFRILGTSSGSLLSSAVTLVCPLRFTHLAAVSPDGTTLLPNAYWSTINGVGPRRNALARCMQSITTTVNSSVSFAVRSAEMRGWDSIYSTDSYPKYQGGRETGTLGPDGVVQPELYDLSVVPATGIAANGSVAGAGAPLAYSQNTDYAWLPQGEWANWDPRGVNQAFAERRRDFITGNGAKEPWLNANGSAVAANLIAAQGIQMNAMTCLNIPPFQCYDTRPYQEMPSMLPFINSIDVTINWDRYFKDKFLVSKDTQTGCHYTANDCTVAWDSAPYLIVEFVQPPYALTRPVSVPAWRVVSYSTPVTIAAGVTSQSATIQNLRFDSFPTWLSILAEPTETFNAVRTTLRRNFHALDMLCPLSGLDITVNEKAKLLSDKQDIELYYTFRKNTKSKITYRQWKRSQCQYVVRSDDLAITSENVYEPMSLSIQCVVSKDANADPAAEQNYTLRILAGYMAESLTLSQQSASVTSLLLSRSDWSGVSMTSKAAEDSGPSIQDYS